MKQNEFDKWREIAEADRIEARLEQVCEQLAFLQNIMMVNRQGDPIISLDKCGRLAGLKADADVLSKEILEEISKAKSSFGCEYMGAITDAAGVALVKGAMMAGAEYLNRCIEQAKKKDDGVE